MGRAGKRHPLIKWMQHIHEDCSVVTRQFLSIVELYDIYKTSHKNRSESFESISSFKRLIDSIVRHGLYKNSKSKVLPRTKATINERITKYIIVNDNEVSLDVEEVRIIRTRKRSKRLVANHQTSQSQSSSHNSQPDKETDKEADTADKEADTADKEANTADKEVDTLPITPTFNPITNIDIEGDTYPDSSSVSQPSSNPSPYPTYPSLYPSPYVSPYMSPYLHSSLTYPFYYPSLVPYYSPFQPTPLYSPNTPTDTPTVSRTTTANAPTDSRTTTAIS